ncbi:MAG: hypothetical protein ACYC77_09100 [Coriobacteriia bacterium]
MADDVDVKQPEGGVQPKRSRRGWWMLAVLVIVTALAVGGYLALQAINRPRDARAKLAEASALLSQAEPGLLAIDGAVRSEVTSALAEGATEALEEIDPTKSTLSDALAEIAAARENLAEEDVQLADALQEAIDSRLDMLDRARPILETDLRASAVVDPAREAWQLVADAEKLADDAVAQYNKHTKAGVQESTKLTTSAETKLTAARSGLATVSAGFSEADMTPFVSYIDAKLKLLASSRKIDSTWLAGKIEDANNLLDAYNAEEKKVIALAAKMPESPTAVVAGAYETLTATTIKDYFAARDAARAADAKVTAIGKTDTDK